MRHTGLRGIGGRPRYRTLATEVTASDLVDRRFARSGPDQPWMTGITDHPTLRGQGVLLRRARVPCPGGSWTGRSIAHATAALVTNALGLAIERREPAGTVIDSGQGDKFTSWAVTRRACDSGLVPSMGSVGDCLDNAAMEALWSRVHVELLDRQRWTTRIELATALCDSLEIFHNRERRHCALGMRTPREFELEHLATTAAAQKSSSPRPRNPGHGRFPMKSGVDQFSADWSSAVPPRTSADTVT